MPTYDYVCKKCKKIFEIFHNVSTSVSKCPECGGRLERLITPNAGLIFKGSGFYQTDYKRKSDGNGSGKEKEMKTDKKTDNKTEKKTEKEKVNNKK